MVDYDPHDWRSHLFDMRGSLVVQIFYRVLLCVTLSAGVAVVHFRVRPLGVSPQGHMLVGLALGLLLVFRTNASYDRFWEGRKLWGSTINDTRNLGRAAAIWLAADAALARDVLRWIRAFAWSTAYHLRGEKGLGPVGAVLADEQEGAVLAARHPPLAVAALLGRRFDEARRRELIDPQRAVALENLLQALTHHLGGCERIHKTPLPYGYVVHLRRALIAYCLTLPFALVESFGWWTPVATLLIAYTLYGIEEIGVEIEDPFDTDANSLPLERFCETIDANLRELEEGLVPAGGE